MLRGTIVIDAPTPIIPLKRQPIAPMNIIVNMFFKL